MPPAVARRAEMPSDRTFVTELATGLGMFGDDDLDAVLGPAPGRVRQPDRPRSGTASPTCGRPASTGPSSSQGFLNGRALPRRPRRPERAGAADRRVDRRTPSPRRRGGAVGPAGRPRLPGQLQVPLEASCTTRARPGWSTVARPGAGRRRPGLVRAGGAGRVPGASTRCAGGRPRSPAARVGARSTAAPGAGSVTLDAAGRTAGRARTTDCAGPCREADRRGLGRCAIRAANAEAVAWRLLRIGSAPYYVLGADPRRGRCGSGSTRRGTGGSATGSAGWRSSRSSAASRGSAGRRLRAGRRPRSGPCGATSRSAGATAGSPSRRRPRCTSTRATRTSPGYHALVGR